MLESRLVIDLIERMGIKNMIIWDLVIDFKNEKM